MPLVVLFFDHLQLAKLGQNSGLELGAQSSF